MTTLMFLKIMNISLIYNNQKGKKKVLNLYYILIISQPKINESKKKNIMFQPLKLNKIRTKKFIIF